MSRALTVPPTEPAPWGRRSVSRPMAWAAPALAGLVVYVAWFTWALEHGNYDAWGTLLIAPALLALSFPLLRRAVRLEPDRRIANVIVVAFFLKLAMAFVNHAVAFVIYGGVADSRGYHAAGVRYARAFRSGDFTLATDGELGRRFVNSLTGAVYTVTGPSRLGGYLVFASFGFWGLYLFHRAFTLAMPGADRHRYALLLFLFPSTLFWTSAIGKEAWMTLALGTGALGAARLLTRRRGGLVLLGVGLTGCAMCRPHVAFMVFVAVLAGYLLRRTASSSRIGPLATLAGLVVMMGLGLVVASRFAETFDVASLSPGSIQTALEKAERQSGGGNSAFDSSSLPWPLAVPGVLFRPLPIEAHNAQSLVASLEGTALLALFLISRRRLGRAARTLLTNPYLLTCTVYSAIFLVAFSVFRNFGTLARERVQLLPFALVLLTVPIERRRRRPARFGPPPLETGPPARTPEPVMLRGREDGP